MISWLKAHCDAILASVPAQRLLALDALRGLTITGMILVNNPGSWNYVYGPLRHAQWHGWTVTDLIFPFFIVIVGMSLQFSLQRQHNQGKNSLPKSQLIRHAATRSLKLFGLGLFLALFYFNFADPAYSYIEQKLLNLRWLGVLQRIGLVYFATMLIVLYCGTRAGWPGWAGFVWCTCWPCGTCLIRTARVILSVACCYLAIVLPPGLIILCWGLTICITGRRRRLLLTLRVSGQRCLLQPVV